MADEIIGEQSTIETATEPKLEPVPEPISDVERKKIVRSTEILIDEIQPLVRADDVTVARELAKQSDYKTVVTYFVENVPYVKEKLVEKGISLDNSDEVIASEIRKILKERAESLVCGREEPPPFLGNDINEAREKQENSDFRMAKQYRQVPFVQPVFRGRSAVDNPYYNEPHKGMVKARRNPAKRIKFL